MVLISESPTVSSSIASNSIHRSSLLTQIPGIVHGITRRMSGTGLADGNVGYSAPRNRDDAWSMRQQWMSAAGLDPNRIVVAYQTHGAEVAVVTNADAGKGADPFSKPVGYADALIASEPGLTAMTLHADCMPVLLCDPIRRVVATIHAGWRGTVADVVGATVSEMRDQFGVSPSDVVALLGPAIGGCCYEVGDDVAEAWRATARQLDGDALVRSGERWRFDLEVANRALHDRAGLRDDRIEHSGICTMCRGDDWFSHRGQGPLTGRYGAFIALAF
jgi:YfiH family protein